ncbi:CRISPR-associated protein Cas5 [Intestinibacter sp.]
MQALRIVIKQSSANYRKEETITNKMTYPLPPLSTIIGAIHNACGYTEYRSMDISIQGKFNSMHKEPYTDYCFLNSVMDDRGILVKVCNENFLSAAFEKVASAKKSQGNSFRNGITIQVHNQELLNEYRRLKDLSDKIKEFKNTKLKHVYETIKKRKKSLSAKKSKFDKNSDEFKKVVAREKEVKALEKKIKEDVKQYEYENYTKPISKYKSLTTSLKYYEILNDIELILHIRSDEKTLSEILENVYNIKSIGRSEDFIDVVEAKIVNLYEGECDVVSPYSAYLNIDDVRNGYIFSDVKSGQQINGTKYYINKNYTYGGKNNKQRIFEKVKVLYTSNYAIEETSDNIFVDNEDGKEYIVNFL